MLKNFQLLTAKVAFIMNRPGRGAPVRVKVGDRFVVRSGNNAEWVTIARDRSKASPYDLPASQVYELFDIVPDEVDPTEDGPRVNPKARIEITHSAYGDRVIRKSWAALGFEWLGAKNPALPKLLKELHETGTAIYEDAKGTATLKALEPLYI